MQQEAERNMTINSVKILDLFEQLFIMLCQVIKQNFKYLEGRIPAIPARNQLLLLQSNITPAQRSMLGILSNQIVPHYKQPLTANQRLIYPQFGFAFIS